MKITKYGHCCLLVEEKGVRFLTDPGTFTADAHASLTGIDAILYTHEHGDHYHLDSLTQLLENNPDAIVLCNEGVSVLLAAEHIAHTVLTNGAHTHKGISITGVSGDHAEIHSSIPRIQNTGFLIAGRLWYPGDAWIDPGTTFDVLALPVAGPWMKISEAADYAIRLAPKKAFPVHDMILHPQFAGFVPRLMGSILAPHGIAFQEMTLGEMYEL